MYFRLVWVFFVFLFFSKIKVVWLIIKLLILRVFLSLIFCFKISSWTSLLFLLIYIRGLLVIFFYFCSLIKKISNFNFNFFFFFFFFLKGFYKKFFFFKKKENRNFFFSFKNQGYLILLVLILLLSLWLVGKLKNFNFSSFRLIL